MQALPEEAVERYRSRLASSSSLPLLTRRAAAEARWPADPAGGSTAAGLPPQRVLVGGGAEDAIVDGAAVEEVRLGRLQHVLSVWPALDAAAGSIHLATAAHCPSVAHGFHACFGPGCCSGQGEDAAAAAGP